MRKLLLLLPLALAGCVAYPATYDSGTYVASPPTTYYAPAPTVMVAPPVIVGRPVYRGYGHYHGYRRW